MFFLQVPTIVRKPLCPTLIHDEPTRILVCLVGIVFCSVVLWRVMRYFNSP